MRKQGFIYRYKLHHFAIWGLVFCLWYYLRYQDYSSSGRAIAVTLVKTIDLAVLIYLTNYLLIPRLLYKKSYFSFAATFVLMIAASSFIKMQIIGQIMHNPGLFDLSDPAKLKERIYDNVIPHFFLVTAGAAVKFLYDHSRMQQRLAEMAKEKAEAELNFLKSQINPHFLFNSLNAVYFLINKENTEARMALHKFSDMLRYQLYEMNGSRIPIEKEVAYLRDYVDLQKLRKDENYLVEFNCTADVRGFSIEPLLLIPFVENAFKHISHFTGEKNYVYIDIARTNGTFSFLVRNSAEKDLPARTAGGIGLNNVRRRLELLYPGRYSLVIDEKDKSYRVSLELKTDG